MARLLGALLVLTPLVAHGLLPPLSPEELEAEVDVVVEVTVESVAAHGDPYEDRCYGWQGYRAQLVVDKVTKGKPGKVITVGYADVINNEKGCDGGKTPYSLGVGMRYQLYLSAGKADAETVVYRFINWAGVNSIPHPPAKTAPATPPAPATSPAPPSQPGAPPPVAPPPHR